MTALFALLAGKGILATLLGGGAVSGIGAFFAGPFRKPLLIVAAVLIVIGFLVTADLVIRHKISAYGAERYAAGVATKQAEWNTAVDKAKLLRAGEEHSARADMDQRELSRQKDEDADDAQNEKLNLDLRRELAVERFQCTIPSRLLAPRRALNPRAH